MRFRQVHLDFHTSELIEGIGAQFSKENFQQMLRLGHVDSITVFAKCHHGWAYHPSEANETHPHLTFDLLGEQIAAAHEIGVKTPVYLSAGLDEKIARLHPEWLIRAADESTPWVQDFMHPGYHAFCMNTPYLDILLAQIREVAKNYDVDGIFLDIVGIKPCVCQHCVRDILARGKDPRDEAAVLEQAELTYQNYLAQTRAAVDAVKPGLPLFHNSGHITRGRRDLAFANTHLELESLPTGGWGYDHFPLSARYVQGLGLPFLGMTGKFHTTWGEFGGYKHPNALRYEAALSLTNGAHCSIGDQLHPSGKMDEATYRLIGAAYAEVEQKEPWCKDATNVADIGVLSIEALQGPSADKSNIHDAGAAHILLEGNYLFDILDLQSDFTQYKVLILPDEATVDDTLRPLLEAYVNQGGKILASGSSGLTPDKTRFALDFGARFGGPCAYNPTYVRPGFALQNFAPASFVLYSQAQEITPCGAQVLAIRENPYFNRDVFHFCSHQHAPTTMQEAGAAMTQNETGIYIAYNIFEEYATKASLILKELVCHALDTLLGAEKTLIAALPAQGVTTLQQQAEQNRYVHHLLYAAPVKRGEDICVIEDIVPLYDVKASVALSQKIKRVYLAPQMEEFPFAEKDGRVCYTVPKLDCHQMVVLEY